MDRKSMFVVTISRQLGAGGVYVGQQLAKKLNLFYADHEIINRAAKELSVLEETLEAREEKLSSFWRSFLQSYALGAADAYVPSRGNIPTSLELFNAESRVIRRIAEESPAVILGRCGSHILRDHPNHVSVFLHGHASFRAGRISEHYHLSGEAARKALEKSDKERALYHRTFAGGDWTDATKYDIALNTGKIGLDRSVEIILKYLENQTGRNS